MVIEQGNTIQGAFETIRVSFVPTAALTGFPRGAKAVNTATGVYYSNTGTETAPAWVVIGLQV